MGSIFGKPKKKQHSAVTEQDKAILQLKQQRDKLKQYQKRISIQLEKEKEVARELLRKDKKQKALSLLKKKRYMEGLLSKAEIQVENLEKMVADIEFASIEVQVIEGLKAGNESLKDLHSMMSVEQIEDILNETREGVEKQKEIDDLLSGAFTEQDEAELLEELEAMTSGEETGLKLPEVPSNQVEEQENPEPEEEEEGETPSVVRPTKKAKTKQALPAS
jgi:charged multivesicular body protein 6